MGIPTAVRLGHGLELRPPPPLARGRHTTRTITGSSHRPRRSRGRACRCVFPYQGLVPKLWKRDRAEVAIWQGLGLPTSRAERVVRAVGAVEAGFAVATVVASNKRWPFAIAIAAMPALAIGAANAFNPASLGVAVAALGGVALATTDGRPSGRRPLRHAPDRQPDVEELP